MKCRKNIYMCRKSVLLLCKFSDDQNVFCAVLGRFPDFPYLSVDFCVLI